jgi:ornithine carbamoyltransferase
MRSLLRMSDLSASDLDILMAKAGDLKKRIKAGREVSSLNGKIVGLLFEKPSTRTRTGFEVASLRLGGHSLYLSANELQLSRGEPVKDTARILGGYLDIIVGRVFAQDTVDQLAQFSGVPVVNALSELEHPTQIIADFFTILEAKGRLKGLKIAYVGDGDNVCNSLVMGSAIAGVNISVACPRTYHPDESILERAEKVAKTSGSAVEVTDEPSRAARDADVIYTDVWVSMGDEAEKDRRIRAFKGYQVNSKLLEAAKPDASVMHCLPAHRGLEITDDVIEGPRSIVWKQGENKLYGAAAVLEWLVKQ